MQVNSFVGLLGAIVTVALVTTIVKNEASIGIIKAFGGAFSSSLKAAQGN